MDEERFVANLFASGQGRLLLGTPYHGDRGHQWPGVCQFVHLCVRSDSTSGYFTGSLDPTPGASTAHKQLLRTDARAAEPGQTCCRCACAGQREGTRRPTCHLLNACFVLVLRWTRDRIPAIGR